MRLTDNEKRDVVKYLEAGKPLPEKYRFLLFDDDREVELVWNGKSNEVANVVLPFQVIEQIDEPRSDAKFGMQESLFDTSGRQITGWTNKLIWGDNKLILSSLKNGPLRKEIEDNGGIKLIYIDPPFDVGADFSINVQIGDEEFTKKPSIIEEIAFRDTWGKGIDSFIAMIYERLLLMRDLLSADGSIYVHCDYRVNSYLRLVLDEIFGKENFKNSIVWKRTSAHNDPARYGMIDDSILFYTKSDKWIWNNPKIQYEDWYIDRYYRYIDPKTKKRFLSRDITAPSHGSNSGIYEWKGKLPGRGRMWAYTKSNMELLELQDKLFYTENGIPRLKQYLDEMDGNPLQSIWDDILPIVSWSTEDYEYPTQKPIALLERIITASSKEGNIIADLFVGSGTTLVAAEKLGRKWIGADLGRFGIHTSRKRLIGVQRELKKAGKDFRAFEILNIGTYERDNYLAVNDDLRAEEKAKQIERKEKEFVRLIISAYKAESVEGFVTITGKKRDRLVAVGPINTPVSHKLIQEIVKECKEKKLTKIDVLGFDYEMGMDLQEYRDQGIDLAFRIIPREVFDKKAVEKNQVKFYDVAYIEAKPIIKGRVNSKELSIELTDFSVFYNQDANEEVAEALRPGGVKVVVENGQVVKISKDKKSELIEKEILTKKWSDWIDYWAVDYNFADRKEVIYRKKEEFKQAKLIGAPDPSQSKLPEFEEVWTGDYIFDNEWQSFRTKKNRNLELVSAPKEITKGTYKVAVKVVDIFGNDTTRVISVTI